MSGLERQLWRRRRSLCTRQRTWAAGNLSPTTRSPRRPDYKGVIRGGRAVAFEAKYTTTGRMEQGRVTSEQAERLDKYFALGAYAFVLAGFGDDAVYRIPWSIWKDMKEIVGRKYVTPDDLEEYRLHIGPGRIIFIFD